MFEAALAGGGAKSINFQELAADLAEITFAFPFRIPPYFALIIRAISVLEGIALVGNPEFAIVDEAYPYISKRLMTDDSPRLRAAFRYMVYGKTDTLDANRMIDMLQAVEKFVAVKDYGDGSSFKVDGVRGGVYVGRGGDSVGTKKVDTQEASVSASIMEENKRRLANSPLDGFATVSPGVTPLVASGSDTRYIPYTLTLYPLYTNPLSRIPNPLTQYTLTTTSTTSVAVLIPVTRSVDKP